MSDEIPLGGSRCRGRLTPTPVLTRVVSAVAVARRRPAPAAATCSWWRGGGHGVPQLAAGDHRVELPEQGAGDHGLRLGGCQLVVCSGSEVSVTGGVDTVVL